VVLGESDLGLLVLALTNRMTHHGRAEARLKIGPGGWHYTLCERYRALRELLIDAETVLVLGEASIGIAPEMVLPEPEPDPIDDEEERCGLP
ncbi:MAG: hypothetical protein ABWY63_14405, partial [Hyphomicrobiaceae bacterium]